MTQQLELPTQETQDYAIKRVNSRLGSSIVAFCQSKGDGGEFYAEDLLAHIEAHVGKVAPDSPGRILRQLRRSGQLDYEVVNRRKSHYRVLA